MQWTRDLARDNWERLQLPRDLECRRSSDRNRRMECFIEKKNEGNSLDKSQIRTTFERTLFQLWKKQMRCSENTHLTTFDEPLSWRVLFFVDFFSIFVFTRHASCFLHTSAVTVSSSACISTVGRRDTFLLAEINTLTQCRAQIAWS